MKSNLSFIRSRWILCLQAHLHIEDLEIDFLKCTHAHVPFGKSLYSPVWRLFTEWKVITCKMFWAKTGSGLDLDPGMTMEDRFTGLRVEDLGILARKLLQSIGCETEERFYSRNCRRNLRDAQLGEWLSKYMEKRKESRVTIRSIMARNKYTQQKFNIYSVFWG